MAYIPKRAHVPGQPIKTATSRAVARAVASRAVATPSPLRLPRFPVSPRGIGPAGAIIVGWLLWEYYFSGVWHPGPVGKSRIVGPWTKEFECFSPPATFSGVWARTGKYSASNMCKKFFQGTESNPSNFPSGWPTEAKLNDPSFNYFGRYWRDAYPNNTLYGKYKEGWKRDDDWMEHPPTIIQPPLIPPPPAPGVSNPGVTGVPPYIFNWDRYRTGVRGWPKRGVKGPTKTDDIRIDITKDKVRVTKDKAHKPGKGVKERKFYPKSKAGWYIASAVFWLWEAVDDATDWLKIMAEASGWKSKGGKPYEEYLDMIDHLRDLDNWEKMDWAEVMRGGAAWYLDELLHGRVYGKYEDAVAEWLQRGVNMGTGDAGGVDSIVVLNPDGTVNYEATAGFGDSVVNWLMEMADQLEGTK